MPLTWKPLGIPPLASPEEAFMAAARVSSESECVMLAWSKLNGWGGCFGVPSCPSDSDPAPVIHLMNIGDTSVLAIRRIQKIPTVMGGNGNE